MKLFTVAKVPMFCDGINHRLEKRKSGDVKVVDLTLRIQPFTTQTASALDQAEYGFVKRLLFRVSDGSPLSDLKAVEFCTPSDRQTLTCFHAVDIGKASIALDQVKVTKLRARKQKDVNGWAFYVYVSFGPLSRGELEYVNAYYTEQRWVTFDEAEPSLDFLDKPTEDEDEEEAADDTTARPPLEFETTGEGAPLQASADDQEPARQMPRRHARKTH